MPPWRAFFSHPLSNVFVPRPPPHFDFFLMEGEFSLFIFWSGVFSPFFNFATFSFTCLFFATFSCTCVFFYFFKFFIIWKLFTPHYPPIRGDSSVMKTWLIFGIAGWEWGAIEFFVISCWSVRHLSGGQRGVFRGCSKVLYRNGEDVVKFFKNARRARTSRSVQSWMYKKKNRKNRRKLKKTHFLDQKITL